LSVYYDSFSIFVLIPSLENPRTSLHLLGAVESEGQGRMIHMMHSRAKT
jgi:hypothetical protein